MSKTDTCTRCGREGHTASSCKRVQCLSCEGFRMSMRKIMHACERTNRIGWSPSPTSWRECKQFAQAKQDIEAKRRKALRDMGYITA